MKFVSTYILWNVFISNLRGISNTPLHAEATNSITGDLIRTWQWAKPLGFWMIFVHIFVSRESSSRRDTIHMKYLTLILKWLTESLRTLSKVESICVILILNIPNIFTMECWTWRFWCYSRVIIIEGPNPHMTYRLSLSQLWQKSIS